MAIVYDPRPWEQCEVTVPADASSGGAQEYRGGDQASSIIRFDRRGCGEVQRRPTQECLGVVK